MYRILHKPTQKFIWYEKNEYGFSSELAPDEYNKRLPSKWDNLDDAMNAMGTTTFGMNNLELVEFFPCGNENEK